MVRRGAQHGEDMQKCKSRRPSGEQPAAGKPSIEQPVLGSPSRQQPASGLLSVPQPSGVHKETQQLAFSFSALKRKKAQDRKVFDEQEKMNGLSMPVVPLRINR